MSAIYLDNAATTFPKPDYVIQAVAGCLCNYAANPKRGSSPLVKLANQQLTLARTTLARHFGCSPDQLVFVSSATFGINQVMQGLPLKQGDIIYLSPFEHNAVARSAEHLRQSKGIEVRRLPIDRVCNLDIDEAKRWFAVKPPRLVAITHASNVTGDILPIKQVIDLTHEHGGRVLVDGAQSVGAYTPRLDEYDYDFLAFSSHKGLYGIPGSGGLVIKAEVSGLTPLVFGGTGVDSEAVAMPLSLPERFEAGTHSLPAIVSMRAGFEWLEQTGFENVRNRVSDLCGELVEGIDRMPGVRVVGRKSPYGNTGVISLAFDWISPQEVCAVLDAAGISVRAGLHCAPLAHAMMGTMPNGTVRVSPSYFNRDDGIAVLMRVLESF